MKLFQYRTWTLQKDCYLFSALNSIKLTILLKHRSGSAAILFISIVSFVSCFSWHPEVGSQVRQEWDISVSFNKRGASKRSISSASNDELSLVSAVDFQPRPLQSRLTSAAHVQSLSMVLKWFFSDTVMHCCPYHPHIFRPHPRSVRPHPHGS